MRDLSLSRRCAATGFLHVEPILAGINARQLPDAECADNAERTLQLRNSRLFVCLFVCLFNERRRKPPALRSAGRAAETDERRGERCGGRSCGVSNGAAVGRGRSVVPSAKPASSASVILYAMREWRDPSSLRSRGYNDPWTKP